jgi:hypothetical protein
VGSTRVPRVQFGVPPNWIGGRTSGVDHASDSGPHPPTVSGATPETTRETRVLPHFLRACIHLSGFSIRTAPVIFYRLNNGCRKRKRVSPRIMTFQFVHAWFLLSSHTRLRLIRFGFQPVAAGPSPNTNSPTAVTPRQTQNVTFLGLTPSLPLP